MSEGSFRDKRIERVHIWARLMCQRVDVGIRG